jgi:hypothetical protein
VHPVACLVFLLLVSVDCVPVSFVLVVLYSYIQGSSWKSNTYLGSHGSGSTGITIRCRWRSSKCATTLWCWRVSGYNGWFCRWCGSDGLRRWIARAEGLALAGELVVLWFAEAVTHFAQGRVSRNVLLGDVERWRGQGHGSVGW